MRDDHTQRNDAGGERDGRRDPPAPRDPDLRTLGNCDRHLSNYPTTRGGEALREAIAEWLVRATWRATPRCRNAVHDAEVLERIRRLAQSL
jgi:hypothetical protein